MDIKTGKIVDAKIYNTSPGESPWHFGPKDSGHLSLPAGISEAQGRSERAGHRSVMLQCNVRH